MTWAIDQTPPDAESKLILLLLANYSGSENTCWPSVPRLARETLLAERTVRKRLHDLSEAGFIKITPRINPTHGDADSNLYLLLMPQVGHDMPHGGAHEAPGGGARRAGKPVSTEPVNEPNTPAVAFETIRQALVDAFYRPAESPWSYLEESTLHELVLGRPKIDLELQMILDWRSKLDPAKRKFFPTSIQSLLLNWSKTLDRARLFFKEPEPQPKSARIF